MSKKIKSILLISTSFVLGVLIYFYSQFYNYYERGSNDYFKINVGESFTVKFYENTSAQSRECWMNEGNCLHVKTVGQDYQRRFFSDGCDGCGGFKSWTFVGYKKGIDTIKLNYCPPEYWDNSIRTFSEDRTNQIESIDYEFVVEVSD